MLPADQLNLPPRSQWTTTPKAITQDAKEVELHEKYQDNYDEWIPEIKFLLMQKFFNIPERTFRKEN